MVGSQTRSDFTRDPCPWRIVEDMGSAYSLGLAGGAIWQGGKSVIKREFRKVPRMIRQNAPKTGAPFAMWGFAFSMCDCTLIAVRKKEDIFNHITAGAAAGGILAARQGFAVASLSAATGGLFLGLVEVGTLIASRMGTEMLRPRAPPTQNAPQAFD